MEPLPDKQNLTVYICGPTVYSYSHLGHARTYLAFDIIRRILEKKFNKNIILIMNITDIDDKVIAKANAENVNYKEISRRFEKLFWEDMEWLDVEYPSIVCHVSEKVKEQQDFVQVLLDKEYAYISNGSVYFNSQNFQKHNHIYPKLRNWTQNQTNQQLLEEAEGKLFIQQNKNNTQEKLSASDWALLKATKANEQCATFDMSFKVKDEQVTIPVRFGWHLECSVMIHETVIKGLKTQLDLHWGGKDLQFPHHANELAQLEAYLDSTEDDLPIKGFMHSGHLNINNQKMSKSLNNFTTIKAASEQVTTDQLRILVLQYPYSSDLEFNSDSIEQAINTEKRIKNWFAQVQAEIKSCKDLCDIELSNQDIIDLGSIQQLKSDIYAMYANDFDYVSAMKKLVGFIDIAKNFSNYVKIQAAEALKEEFQVLGLHFNSQNDSSNSAQQIQQLAQEMAKIRWQMQQALLKINKQTDLNQLKQNLFSQLDEIRDNVLLPQGYLIEDKDNNYTVKQIDYQSYQLTKKREEQIKKEKEEMKLQEQKMKEEAQKAIENREQAIFNQRIQQQQYVNEIGEIVDITMNQKKINDNIKKIIDRYTK